MTKAGRRAVLIVESHIRRDDAPQVRFVQRDDVVQRLSADTPYPAFSQSILPRRFDTCPLGFQTGRLDELDHIGVELGVAIKDEIALWTVARKCLAQLLNDLFRRGM